VASSDPESHEDTEPDQDHADGVRAMERSPPVTEITIW
jgi:hypothetical protein